MFVYHLEVWISQIVLSILQSAGGSVSGGIESPPHAEARRGIKLVCWLLVSYPCHPKVGR